MVIHSVFCSNPVCLLLNGLTFCQDSDLLGVEDGEKENAKEERIVALVSTFALNGITRFILISLLAFLDLVV